MPTLAPTDMADVIVTTPDRLQHISFDPKLRDVGENLMNIDHYRPATQRRVDTMSWVHAATRELLEAIGGQATRGLAVLWHPVLRHTDLEREAERCERAFAGQRANLQVLIEASEPYRARELAAQRDDAAEEMLRALSDDRAFVAACLAAIDERVAVARRVFDALEKGRAAIEAEAGHYRSLVGAYRPADEDAVHWGAWAARIGEIIEEERGRCAHEATRRAKRDLDPADAVSQLVARRPSARHPRHETPIAVKHVHDACMRAFETRAIGQLVSAFERAAPFVGRCPCGGRACSASACATGAIGNLVADP